MEGVVSVAQFPTLKLRWEWCWLAQRGNSSVFSVQLTGGECEPVLGKGKQSQFSEGLWEKVALEYRSRRGRRKTVVLASLDYYQPGKEVKS